MAGYIGAQPLTKASYDKKLFIATAGQTTFQLSYNPYFLDILLNGVEVNTSDYTATDGLTVEFINPLTAGDEVTFKIWGTFNVADTYTQAEIDAKDAIPASEIVSGVIKVATQTQTDAGTDDSVAVTPKKMRWGFSTSLATNGYIIFPSWMGGLVMQWVRGSLDQNTTDTRILPVAFPSTYLVGISNKEGAYVANTTDSALLVRPNPTNPLTQVDTSIGANGGSVSHALQYTTFVIGY